MRRAVAVTTAFLLASCIASPADATPAPRPPAEPGRQVTFHPADSDARTPGARGAGMHARSTRPVRSTGVVALPSQMAVVGVTWAEGTGAGLRLSVREKRSGRWSAWRRVGIESCPTCGPHGHTRAGSDPLTVSGASHVEARLVGGADARDARLSVIDASTGAVLADATPAPGGSGAVALAATQSRRQATTARRTTARRSITRRATDAPTVIGRESWGAFGTRRTRALRPRGVVVHHTAGTNDYTPAQVPGILRAIQEFHVKDRGWTDIGYNVVVDRYGRAWEGRPGGFADPHVGSHTKGVNSTYLGVAYLGDSSRARATEPAVDEIVDLIGWAADRYRFDPEGSLRVAGAVEPVVAGHYQLGTTSCPGADLTRRLPQIRERATEAARRQGRGR